MTTPSIGSGLGSTWGVTKEGTVGTFTTSGIRILPFLTDKFKGEKKTVDSPVLHGGLYELGGRRRLTFHGAKGPVEMEAQDRQLGLILQAMIGSTPTIVPGNGVWTLAVSGVPTGGTFQLSYAGSSVSIQWNSSAASAQTQIQTLPGLSAATCSGGALPGTPITITLAAPTLLSFTIGTNSLSGGTTPTPTVVPSAAGTAFMQVHNPGDTQGTSFSVQAGRAEVLGTLQQFNYNGCKVTEWELALQRDAIAKLSVSWDGWDETTATSYASPGYISSHPLAFVDGTVLLGGTTTTVGGVISGIAAGAAPVGTIESITIKGSNVFDTDRQNIGSLVKREQIANGFRQYTGEMVVEFANLTDLYNFYYNDTATTLQLNMQGVSLGGGLFAQMQTWCPQIYYDGEPPETDGPTILKTTVPFKMYDDGIDPAMQFNYQSLDTSV